MSVQAALEQARIERALHLAPKEARIMQQRLTPATEQPTQVQLCPETPLLEQLFATLHGENLSQGACLLLQRSEAEYRAARAPS